MKLIQNLGWARPAATVGDKTDTFTLRAGRLERVQMTCRTTAVAGMWACLGLFGLALPAQALHANSFSPVKVHPRSIGTALQESAPKVLATRRINTDRAKFRNLASEDTLVIATPKRGTLIHVFQERAGWQRAEIPGGFPVWVHGRFLRPTDQKDVWEVIGDGVNVRGLPNSSVNNYPIGQLYRGDLVRAAGGVPPVEQDATGAETESEWLNVWSPEGFGAWIKADQTEALAETEDADKLWSAALAALGTANAQPVGKKAATLEASSAKPEQGDAAEAGDAAPGAAELLRKAQGLLAAAREASDPDLAAVREVYAAISATKPSAIIQEMVQKDLVVLEALEKMARMHAELEELRLRKQRELQQRQREIWDESGRPGVRTDGHDRLGVLERHVRNGRTTFVLRRGGHDICELKCSSGRYDLNLFAGFEIGLRGSVEETASDRSDTALPLFDATRIQVVARP